VPSVFSRIIAGEFPARFVWKDEACVGFLSINPLAPGHTLVVPRLEIDHWLDVAPELLGHLTTAAQAIGRGQMRAFSPARVGLMIAGLEVAHVHLHVVPIRTVDELSFANADPAPDPAVLDAAADALRTALREISIEQVSN